MKRFFRLTLALGESVWLQALLATPVQAQIVATPSATPTPSGTTSALPQAGTASTSIFLILLGVLFVVLGIVFSLRTAASKVET